MLCKKVRAMSTTEILLETVPRADKNASGLAERAVQSVEDHLRTMVSYLEEKLGERLPLNHPIYDWMTRHEVWVLTG